MADAQAKPVMLVGIDDNEQSFYGLQYVLEHFFTPHLPNCHFKLILIHAKPSPSPALGLTGPGAAEVVPYVQADIKKRAARIVEKVKKFCASAGINDAEAQVIEGDARSVLCEAVDRFHASMLVVGSHGYGPIKRAVLGSVSDHCAHHAHCSVMIVKRHKEN